jgi:hypothetical protein
MTDKAQRVLQKMKRRRLFGNPKVRDRILDEFNRSILDDVGPVGGDKGETFLKELNEMQDLEGGVGRKENPDR